MRLVVDANVLVSAPARDGAVRTALMITTDDVLTPAYIREEVERHRAEIRLKSGLSSEAFDELTGKLLRSVEIVPSETMLPHVEEATRTMEPYDPDDVPYIAAALAVDGTVVSNDRAFEKQRAVPHMWTSAFVERALGTGDEEGPE